MCQGSKAKKLEKIYTARSCQLLLTKNTLFESELRLLTSIGDDQRKPHDGICFIAISRGCHRAQHGSGEKVDHEHGEEYSHELVLPCSSAYIFSRL